MKRSEISEEFFAKKETR